jgi:hypothetical protein
MSTISASVRLTERNDAETRQLRQSAADALQNYSVLAMHSLADNEVSHLQESIYQRIMMLSRSLSLSLSLSLFTNLSTFI